jgi:hypothetical protein
MPVLGRWHGNGELPQEDRWIGTPPRSEVAITAMSRRGATGEG